MNTTPNASPTAASPFNRSTVFGVVLVGFLAFLAMLYFIAAGDTGENRGNGAAHAAATGLNGYAGLVRLLEGEGYDVSLSREQSGLDTSNLLILTPDLNADAEEIGAILENRQYLGPTLVILPKWLAAPPPQDTPDEVADKFEEGWVVLGQPLGPAWASELPSPFTFAQNGETRASGDNARWAGFNLSGDLPSNSVAYTDDSENIEPLVTDGDGRVLAFNVLGEEGTDYYNDAHWTVFVVEPDLVNNYGLSDASRAGVALALVEEVGYGDGTDITFDLTLNGFGGAMNLLTLAFQPPFLAATLCLILALLIVGWRAFMRFGAASTSGPQIAFGKRRLVANGAGLIVRAKRFGLLAGPYAALAARRLAARMGLVRPDAEAIDAAIAARLPDEESFSTRAARLQNAGTPSEILRAARALRELEGKLAK